MSEQTGSETEVTGALEGGPVDPVVETGHSQALGDCEEVRRLAYAFWETRGRPEGSSEEDWFKAERDLKARAAG